MPAPTFDETWAELREIHQALLESNLTATLWFTNDPVTMWPRWYVEVLTSVRSLSQRAPLVYLTSSLTEEPTPTGEVFAFTDRLVIHVALHEGAAAGSDAFQGTAKVTAQVWRRSDLNQVTLLNLDSYPVEPPAFESEHPRHIEFELRYRDREIVHVPLARRPGREGERAAAKVYEELVEDLTRRA